MVVLPNAPVVSVRCFPLSSGGDRKDRKNGGGRVGRIANKGTGRTRGNPAESRGGL